MDYCYLILQILDAPSDAPSEPSSTASLDNSSQINSMNEESASQDKRVADDEQPCSSRSAVESVGDCANEKPACQDKRVADDEQPCSSRSAVESVDDISNVYILSTADGVHVFMAKMIPCEPNSLVHNRSMLPGEAKFEIVTVINKQWQDFDPDFHWPGSYLVWKLELSTPQQLAFDCEGISEDRAKTVSEAGLPHGKKRKRNERNWSAVQKKRRNVTGGGKNMKEPCPASCRLKCSEKLDENTRKACFDEYWGTGSSERQWDFHLNNVRNAPVERRRQCDNAQGDSRRGMSKFYHLHDIHVCKTMYLNTLAISEQIVKTAFKKQVGASKVVSGDARGGKRRDMPEAREAIRRHISLFPTVDSHYCRKETTTAYLSDRLSVSKMHSLYKSWCIANNLKAQSYEYYLGVFNQDFKLSFFKRKKDKCLTCHAFENADVSPTDKTLIFREEECLMKMSLAEIQNYDPRCVDLFSGNSVEKQPLLKEDARKRVQEKIRKFQEEGPTLPAGQASDDDMKYKWRRHLYEKVLSRKLKKQFAEDAHNFPAECTTAAFDLQQVLDCPFTNVGDAFYKRCLSCYNFVVHEKDHSQAHCFFWSQLDGKRGANEMSSCMCTFLREKSELGIKRCCFTCDSCPGQSRNRQMVCALCHAVQTCHNLQSVEILFLLRDHTENDADDIHSAIERRKNYTVYTPNEWAVLIRNLEDTDSTIHLHHLDFGDFLDFTSFSKTIPNFTKGADGSVALNWNELKHIKVEKEKPYVLSFRTEYDGPWQSINLLQKGRKSISVVELDTLPPLKAAYNKGFPVPAEKYDDLQWMCQHLLIPIRYHQFYNAIECGLRPEKPVNEE